MQFRETQYLGRNKAGNSRRLVVMLFCFIFYFVSGEGARNAEMFLILGFIMAGVTIVSIFLPHLKSRIADGQLLLEGPFSYKKASFSLEGITDIRIEPFSRLKLNRPVFNLHRDGYQLFYTHGDSCVVFETKAGERIKLGTQRPDALVKALKG